MTRVLIIGGGIAGTATAMALHKAGLRPVVYEAYPVGGDDAGAFLTVGANGMLALDQIDATGPVAAAGFPLTRLELLDEHGATIGDRPMVGPDPAVPGHHHLRRAELYRVLQEEALRRGIEIERGRRLVGAHARDGGVVASFADGTSATGALLVGADGVHSTVRTRIDPDAVRPRYTGQRVFYGYTRAAAPPTAPETIHMIRGSRTAFGYTVSPQGETWWFARVSAPELTRAQISGTDPATWRDSLVALLRDDRTPAADIVGATGAELLAGNAYDLARLAAWHSGPMIVVGDAAHAASPASGQGASQALEDAVILAKALRDLPGHAEAFAAYEQLRRARVERVIAGGAALSPAKAPDAQERNLRNERSRQEYARPDTGTRNWLFDHPLEWDAPLEPTDSA